MDSIILYIAEEWLHIDLSSEYTIWAIMMLTFGLGILIEVEEYTSFDRYLRKICKILVLIGFMILLVFH